MLRELAKEEHKAIGQVITDLVEKRQRERFWREMREDFTRLRSDPVAWQSYQDELSEWDATLMDGLQDEEPFDDSEEADSANTEVR
jgi:hypothetical protein